jgi:dTDP-glucose 4,6-dehydratase
MKSSKEQDLAVVTGAGGFIGSHLTERLLKEGMRVRALVRYNSSHDIGFLRDLAPTLRKRLDIVHGNVEDSRQVGELCQGARWVFHLAALIGIPYSYSAPGSYVNTNILGTLNILEAGKRHHAEKILVTSTSEVYGTALFTPMTTDHPLQAQSPYSATKIAADKLAESYARSFAVPVMIIRPFNTYGPRQSMRAVIPTIIVQALTSKRVCLGDPTPVRDLNYVADTVDGFLRAARQGKPDGRVYQFASGRGISIGELAKEILEILGCDIPIVSETKRFRPEASEVRRLIGDAAIAKRDLEWNSTVSLRTGLKKTIDWIRKNLPRFPQTADYIR